MTAPGPRRIASADAVVLALAVAFVVALNLTPIYENDFWIQLKVGDLIRETGSIPRTILFACTEAADRPFVAHEWLPSVAESALFARVGYAGMIVVKCALALLLFALVRALAGGRGSAPAVASGIGALVLLAVNDRTQMRPELWALVLFAAMLLLLDRLAAARRPAAMVATVVAIGLVWANTHGSFVLAPALPLLFLAGAALEEKRPGELRHHALRFGTAAAGIGLATLVNPYGPRLWAKALDIAGGRFIRETIVEFAPTFDPRLRVEAYWWVFIAFLAIATASFAGWRRRGGMTPLLLALAFGALSFDAIRFTVWFAIACAPVLGHNLSGIGWGDATREPGAGDAVAGVPGDDAHPARRRPARDRGGIPVVPGLLVVALSAGLVVVFLVGNVRGMRVGFADASPLSPAAVAALRGADLHGNVFNSYRLGDQIAFNFWPRARVTIDSRVDAYGQDYFERYLTLSGRSLKRLGPSADLVGFLDRYSIDTIVSMPYDYRNWTLRDHAEALERAGWKEIFRDDSAVILTRQRP